MKALILILLTFCGCSHPAKNESKKELRLYLQANPISLDPRIGGNRQSMPVNRLLFEGLFRMDRDGGYERALAKSVDISEDGCVYTFTLRSSKWSNGEEVTAYDFEYAWKTILNPNFPTAFAFVFYDIKNAAAAYQRRCSLDDVGITAIDFHTLKVTLEHPCPFFLELLTFPLFSPISRSYCQKGGTSPECLSNGPFVLKKNDVNSQIILDKNPLYWRADFPKVDTISFTIVEDSQTAYNMFCRRDLDWFGEPLGFISLDMIRKIDPKALYKKKVGLNTWLRCQTKESFLSSKYIRKAIASAIDRDLICEDLLNCHESPAQTIVPKSRSLLSTPPFKNGDVEEARRLFEKGLEEIGATKETFPTLTIEYRCDDQMLKDAAGIIQEQIEHALGIKIALQECDYNTMVSHLFSGDFLLSLHDWLTFYQDSRSILNWIKQENLGGDLYNEVVGKADASLKISERQRYLKEAEEIIMDQLPLIPILRRNFKYVKSDCLHGEALSPSGQIDFMRSEKT